jgi:hypothetical protein
MIIIIRINREAILFNRRIILSTELQAFSILKLIANANH